MEPVVRAGEAVRDLCGETVSRDLMIEMELASGELGRELEWTERMEAGDEVPESRTTTSGESRSPEPLLRVFTLAESGDFWVFLTLVCVQ